MRGGFLHKGTLLYCFILLCLTHKWKKINQSLSWTIHNTFMPTISWGVRQSFHRQIVGNMTINLNEIILEVTLLKSKALPPTALVLFYWKKWKKVRLMCYLSSAVRKSLALRTVIRWYSGSVRLQIFVH